MCHITQPNQIKLNQIKLNQIKLNQMLLTTTIFSLHGRIEVGQRFLMYSNYKNGECI